MGTLWYNGMIYTMVVEGEYVEAVFTEDGIIRATGTLASLKLIYQDKISREINLQGNTMFPGFVDSHMHLIGHGERLLQLDVSTFKSRQAVLKVIEEKCKYTPVGNWIDVVGWNEAKWDTQELILRDDLDHISTQHPIIFRRICRHVLVANSRALKEAGVKEDVVGPANGSIGRDENGRLNGLFKEQPTLDLILNKMSDILDVDYVKTALQMAINDAYSFGITGCHTEDLYYYRGFLPTYKAFVSIIEEESMAFRANLLVHYAVFDEWLQFGGQYGEGTTYIKFDAMKIFADGSLGGRTALLSEPYLDDLATNGVAIFSQQELIELVKKARKAEMPVAIHAIGDLAFEYVLNAIEAFPPKNGQRDRIIHAEIVRPDLIARSQGLPIIFDIQPGFVLTDFPGVEAFVPKHLLEFSFAWKTYLRKGIICAGGSDAPIEPLNPLLGIYAAITRQKPSGKDHNKVYGEKERLSPFEAVSLYTKGSATAINQENHRGQIKPGFDADFTVLSQNIFHISPEELLKTQAVLTVIDEKIVYNKLVIHDKEEG